MSRTYLEGGEQEHEYADHPVPRWIVEPLVGVLQRHAPHARPALVAVSPHDHAKEEAKGAQQVTSGLKGGQGWKRRRRRRRRTRRKQGRDLRK